MGSSVKTSRAARQDDANLDSELAAVQAQIRAHRENLATLHAESERDESRFEALKAEHEQMQVELDNLREALREAARKRTALVATLDDLLLSKTRLENMIEKSVADRRTLAAVDVSADVDSDFQGDHTDTLEIDLDVPSPEPMVTAPTFETELEVDMEIRPGAPKPTRAAPPRAAPPPAAPKPKQGAAPPPAMVAKAPQNKIRSNQPRVPMCVDVDLRSENNLYMGFSENISEGGLFVATYTPRPVGERMQVQFTLPNQNRPITCEVEVAWHIEARNVMAHDKDRVPGMGLRFVDLTPDDRAMLLDFVTRREPMFFPA